MTTELEQKFYDTFGIEKRCIRPKDCIRKGICRGAVACDFYTYPEITAEKLLEMICILNNYGKYDCWAVTVARLEDAILENCIAVVVSKLLNDVILEQFKQQIQQLFKEEV